MKTTANINEGSNDNAIEDLELSEITRSIDDFYWVPFLKTPFQSLNEICSEVDHDCKSLAIPFKSFTSNLLAAEKMLVLPYMLISTDMVNAAIKTRGPEILDRTGLDKDKNKEKLIDFTKIILNRSETILFNKKNELKYLMFQACILIWSALENYCKDVFILMLNQRPQLYKKLLADSFLKDKFSISQGSWEKLLEEHGYDLNGKLGHIVASNKDFSSPKLLQKVFFFILDDHPEASDALDYFKSESLWLLGQRRHLLVHRCGIVDDEYMDKTNDKLQKIGEQLSLKGQDISVSFGIAAQCAIVLYGTARHLWDRPDKTELENNNTD